MKHLPPFALAVLALPLLAACGGSSNSNPPAASATQTTTTAAPTPSPEQFAKARDLAVRLRCPAGTEPSQSGGVAVRSVEVHCDVKPTGDSTYSQWHYDVTVWPDSESAQGYVQTIRGAYNPSGVVGDVFVVLAQEQESVPAVKAAVGGQEL